MDRRQREAIHQNLEYMPGAMCSFILGLTFGMAGCVFAIGIVKGKWHWAWAACLFALFGLTLSRSILPFPTALSKMTWTLTRSNSCNSR